MYDDTSIGGGTEVNLLLFTESPILQDVQKRLAIFSITEIDLLPRPVAYAGDNQCVSMFY